MSAAADVMRQTMPDYGPGDEVQTHDGTRYMVYSVRYVPLANGQTCGWRTQTSQCMGGPPGIDRLSYEFTLVKPEEPPASTSQLSDTPPFVAGDLVRIVMGSQLQQNAKFMLTDTLEVVECFRAGVEPVPAGAWVVRLRRINPAPLEPPLDELECFAAKHFEKWPARSVTVRYVKDVQLTAVGELHVEYGEVDVPLP